MELPDTMTVNEVDLNEKDSAGCLPRDRGNDVSIGELFL